MLNKLGKKICAGVCTLSLGFGLNVKSDAIVWDAVVACAEFYTSFRLMQYRVVGPMLKKQVKVEVEFNNIVERVPKVGKTVSVLAGVISMIFVIDAGKRVVNIVSSLKSDKKGEQKLDNEKATNKGQIESSKRRNGI